MIAAIEAYRAGLFAQRNWLPNIVSGLIVGIVALPLAMAFAIASGAKPEQGLYTAIIAGASVSLLGGSRVQIAGPTGAFIVVLASITTQHGIDGLQIATLMAGVILLLFGIARLGAVIKFIPDPVIVGFTAGIGLIIFVGQWHYFLGLGAPTGDHFHEKLAHLLLALPAFHLPTTALALLSLTLIIVTPRIPFLRQVPGPMVALLVVSLIHWWCQFDQVATIGSVFGGIPRGLPAFAIPDISLSKMIGLLGPAFAIAMLGAIESLLSAVVADGMANTKHNSNQELIGQGIANILAPLFGGFAATGAIARTATNVRNGGNSPLAGLVHCLTLLLVILLLAPLAAEVPLCVLAAILFVVAYNMSEAKHFVRMVRQAPRFDVAILLITFFTTVFVDLVVAVNIGVILAMLDFVRRMAQSVSVKPHVEPALKIPPDVLVYNIEGPFFFAAAENFENALAQTHTDPKLLVIRLKQVPFIDITGIQTLEEVIERFKKRGVAVAIAEANDQVKAKLQRAGILQLTGRGHYFDTVLEAIKNHQTT